MNLADGVPKLVCAHADREALPVPPVGKIDLERTRARLQRTEAGNVLILDRLAVGITDRHGAAIESDAGN